MKKFNLEKILELLIAGLLIFIGAGLRIIPHAPNFTPIVAIALFGGAYLSKKTAIALPLFAMAISDIFIGFYEPVLMFAVYGSFVLSVILGFYIKKHKKYQTITIASILSSALFFIVTNFAVWIFTPWYAKNVFGLINCYFMALPFFRNALLGDIFYTAVLFGTYELVIIFVKKLLKAKGTVFSRTRI